MRGPAHACLDVASAKDQRCYFNHCLRIAYRLSHFSNAGEPLNFSDVMTRLKTPVFIALDILLLIFGLYHALYGLYSVFLDFDSGKKEKIVVLGLLVVMGLGFAGFGVSASFILPVLFEPLPGNAVSWR